MNTWTNIRVGQNSDLEFRYVPKSGTDMEVGGIISARSKKNTVNESRIEMDNDT